MISPTRSAWNCWWFTYHDTQFWIQMTYPTLPNTPLFFGAPRHTVDSHRLDGIANAHDASNRLSLVQLGHEIHGICMATKMTNWPGKSCDFFTIEKPWDLKLKMICFMGKIMVKHVLNHMAFCVLHTDKATKDWVWTLSLAGYIEHVRWDISNTKSGTASILPTFTSLNFTAFT